MGSPFWQTLATAAAPLDARLGLNAALCAEKNHPRPEIGAEALEAVLHVSWNEQQIAGGKCAYFARPAEGQKKPPS
jgi:hypothetical protein